MDSLMYRSLVVITAIIGGASSHYEETYNGNIFILPTEERMKRPLEMTLLEAKEWCTNYLPGSTLPRIIEDQDSILQFIQRAVSENALSNGHIVLVNRIQHTLGNWSWINGHDVKDIEVKPVTGGGEVKLYNYGYLWTDGAYYIQASRPNDPRNYICEFANLSTCSSDMIINHKCYRKRNVRVTWFEARNRCLTENGDLASFETLNGTTVRVSLQNFLPDDRRDYWIGIQRNLLHLDDKGSEIKFINWTDGHRSDINDKCLCLSVATELRWIECNCMDSYPFICTHVETETSDQMTQSIELPSTTSAIVSTPMIPITAALSTMISSNDQSAPDNANAVIGAVVSCVIIAVVIIILVVVIFIIRKQRNRAKTTATINEVSVYEELQQRSGNHSIYATIQPTTSDI